MEDKLEIDCAEQKLNLINESDNDLQEIPQISADELTYNQFFTSYMLTNTPVLIKNIKVKTSFSESWFRDDGSFDIDSLRNTLKDRQVPVANCTKQYFDSHEKMEMSFGDYADYWKGERAELLYLKDFHLKKKLPELDYYNVPHYFASDWLNEFLIDNSMDDYIFIYIGPAGSWTSFHSDVFGSFSWSANIYGLKKWLMLPPGEEEKLKDAFGKLPFSIDCDMLLDRNVKYFEVLQNCNETIFVPSGWYHQVFNLEDTISVNHNWFNGCNLNRIADNLMNHLLEVEREIEDCKEMDNYEEQCQVILKASFGLNVQDLLEMLTHIIHKRTDHEFNVFNKFSFGSNHLKFDLNSIRETLVKLKENDVVARNEHLCNLISECLLKIYVE